jgi:hypothetical protein
MLSYGRTILAIGALLALAVLASRFGQGERLPPAEQLSEAAHLSALLLMLAAAVGAAAMATVQFWKLLFRPRAEFHAKELRAFFGERVLGLLAKRSASGTRSVSQTLAQVLDNPTEVVMGQVRAVAEFALARPTATERQVFS